MAGAADHQMVMHGNVQRLGGGGDIAGHFDVGARWGGIAGVMVMHQDDRRGAVLQRALDDLALEAIMILPVFS